MGANKSKKADTSSRRIGIADKRSKVPFNEFRFVRIELTEPEKQEFRALLDSGEFDEIPLDGWIGRGFKISISPDDKGGGIIASLSATYSDSDNKGLVLTARGRDAITALAVLEYKDKYLAGEDGWGSCEDRRGGSYSDIG